MKRESTINFRSRLRSYRVTALMLVLLILVAILLIVLGYMEKVVHGRGTVEGSREYDLKSSVNSRITHLYYRNGDTVSKGAVLVELDDLPWREKMAALAGSIRELEAQIQVKEWALKLLRHDPLPQEYRHTQIALEEASLREAKTKEDLEIYRGLYRSGAVSLMEVQQKEMTYAQSEAALKKLQEDSAKLQEGLADKIIAQAEAELHLLQVRLENRREEYDLLREREREYRFVAPENGTVAFIPTKTGGYVSEGQNVVTIAASGAKRFIALVDEEQIPLVAEGQRARISSSSYSSYDYGYFYGTVYAADVLPQRIGGVPYYRVYIRIDEEPQSLRLGSTGNVEIITGRTRIFKVLTGRDR